MMHFSLLLSMIAAYLLTLMAGVYPSNPSLHDRSTLSVLCKSPFVPAVARSSIEFADMICCPCEFSIGGWGEGGPTCCPNGSNTFQCGRNSELQKKPPGEMEKCYIDGKESKKKSVHSVHVCELVLDFGVAVE
jgi:hypothetical protein